MILDGVVKLGSEAEEECRRVTHIFVLTTLPLSFCVAAYAGAVLNLKQRYCWRLTIGSTVEVYILPPVSGASVEKSHDKLPVIEQLVQVRLLFRVIRAQRLKHQIAHYTVHHLLIAFLPRDHFCVSLTFFFTLFNVGRWVYGYDFRLRNFCRLLFLWDLINLDSRCLVS